MANKKKSERGKGKEGRGGKRIGSGRKSHVRIEIPTSDTERNKLLEAVRRQEEAHKTTVWDEVVKTALTGRGALKLGAQRLIQASLIGTVKVSQSEIKSEHHEHHHGIVEMPVLYPQDQLRKGLPYEEDEEFIPVPRGKPNAGN